MQNSVWDIELYIRWKASVTFQKNNKIKFLLQKNSGNIIFARLVKTYCKLV